MTLIPWKWLNPQLEWHFDQIKMEASYITLHATLPALLSGPLSRALIRYFSDYFICHWYYKNSVLVFLPYLTYLVNIEGLMGKKMARCWVTDGRRFEIGDSRNGEASSISLCIFPINQRDTLAMVPSGNQNEQQQSNIQAAKGRLIQSKLAIRFRIVVPQCVFCQEEGGCRGCDSSPSKAKLIAISLWDTKPTRINHLDNTSYSITLPASKNLKISALLLQKCQLW